MTNTSIIGIANQVDLPFKKKHSAIAMRDCQLLFMPYDTDQIVEILESKVNGRYSSLPTQLKEDKQLRDLFFALIEDRAYEMITRKVSKLNGDIRVAFGYLKQGLIRVQKLVEEKRKEVCGPDGELDYEKIRVSYRTILQVFEQTNQAKSSVMLKSLERQNLMLLKAVSEVFEDFGEEKVVKQAEVWKAIQRVCNYNEMPKMPLKDFKDNMVVLKDYKFIDIENVPKNQMQSLISLQVDLKELVDGLKKKIPEFFDQEDDDMS